MNQEIFELSDKVLEARAEKSRIENILKQATARTLLYRRSTQSEPIRQMVA